MKSSGCTASTTERMATSCQSWCVTWRWPRPRGMRRSRAGVCFPVKRHIILMTACPYKHDVDSSQEQPRAAKSGCESTCIRIKFCLRQMPLLLASAHACSQIRVRKHTMHYLFTLCTYETRRPYMLYPKGVVGSGLHWSRRLGHKQGRRRLISNESPIIDNLELLSTFRGLAHCFAMAFPESHTFL